MTTARKTEPEPLPTAVDPSELCRLILDELTAPLENLLGSKKEADVVKRLVETTFWNVLAKMSQARQLDSKMQPGSLKRGKSRKRGTGKSAITLSVADLTPHEVIESGLVEMSLSQLYRATQQGRFYCAKPPGKSTGRVYPSWQFEEPVTNMLPEVLSVLREQGEKYINARMVTAEDDLMELAPAEVLAGRLFDANEQLHPEQAALLALPTFERLALVKKVFGRPSRENGIG
jgi:hypothetical protein